MIRQFTTKNFRIFSKEGSEFRFKPITFLTGSNSSGKTSLVKAILVVQHYIDTLRNRYSINGSFDPARTNLNISSMNLKLGSYSSCVNKFSEDDVISFSYEVSSDLAPYHFEVTLSFKKSLKDNGTEGELTSIEVKLADEIILQMERENNQLKLRRLRCNGYLMHSFIALMKSMAVYYKNSTSEEWEKYNYGTHETYFKDDAIKNRYPALFKKNLTKALEKCDEYSLMFYFPLLAHFKGLNKSDSIVKLRGLTPSDELEYTRPYDNYNETLERVINSYQSSDYESFIEYYLSLENLSLQEFSGRFRLVGYHTRFDLIRDEICQSMEMKCESIPWTSWSVKEFNDAYTILTMVSWKDNDLPEYVKTNFYYDQDSGGPEFSASHILYDAYRDFVHLLFSEVLMTPIFTNLHYVNDSFTGVQRMYTYANNSSFAKVIREYADLRFLLDGSGNGLYENEYYNKIVKFRSGDFIHKWLKEFCDIESLILNSDEDGQGYILSVKHMNGRTNALADEGHGITQLVHMLLQIECQVLRKKRSILDHPNQFTINYNSLGLDSPILAIEEPEVSLHPSLQSKLALVFEDAYQSFGVTLIIETHSEYLIRKSQAIISQYDTEGKDFKDNPFKIYYFNPDGSSYEISYGESGRLENSFGPGFFDEAGNSSVEVLKREQKSKRK